MPSLGLGIHEFARGDRNCDDTARRMSMPIRLFSGDFSDAGTDNSWMPGPRPGMTKWRRRGPIPNRTAVNGNKA